MKVTITLPDETKTLYDYTLCQLLHMVECATGIDMVEVVMKSQYSFTFLNHQKAFTFTAQ
jgi:hypothetical protein